MKHGEWVIVAAVLMVAACGGGGDELACDPTDERCDLHITRVEVSIPMTDPDGEPWDLDGTPPDIDVNMTVNGDEGNGSTPTVRDVLTQSFADPQPPRRGRRVPARHPRRRRAGAVRPGRELLLRPRHRRAPYRRRELPRRWHHVHDRMGRRADR